MYYLGIDTTNKFLIVSIFNDNEILYFKQEKSDRNASELANVFVSDALNILNIKVSDISAIITTIGPGSFTGVRIGVTLAKVISLALDIPLYSLSSFVYYAGLNDAIVILDARSKKAYVGNVSNGKLISEGIIKCENIEINDNLIGDLSLIGQEDKNFDLKNHFLDLKEMWKLESNLDLKPVYLKSQI